jgi:hypothetical protein
MQAKSGTNAWSTGTGCHVGCGQKLFVLVLAGNVGAPAELDLEALRHLADDGAWAPRRLSARRMAARSGRMWLQLPHPHLHA